MKEQVTNSVAAYVRVSTVGQNEAAQRAAIENWLMGNGIDPTSVRWYTDKKTGDNLKRPGFEKLQADVFAGKVGTVVVYKLDRLSRKLREGINTLFDWCEPGLRVATVTQQIDFNGTMGKMLAAVLLAIAEMEQEPRRERQAAGIAVAKKEGKCRRRKPGTSKAKPERALQLQVKGLTAEEIATALGVARNTVFVYLRQAKAGSSKILPWDASGRAVRWLRLAKGRGEHASRSLVPTAFSMARRVSQP
jgi:DNA invertase Pin-like site-specific DNA recombinase